LKDAYLRGFHADTISRFFREIILGMMIGGLGIDVVNFSFLIIRRSPATVNALPFSWENGTDTPLASFFTALKTSSTLSPRASMLWYFYEC